MAPARATRLGPRSSTVGGALLCAALALLLSMLSPQLVAAQESTNQAQPVSTGGGSPLLRHITVRWNPVSDAHGYEV
ncbi:MAG TPA: hypothetical protein VMW69_08545, partial [Spirochaetia bacterium]|nr:hypothetical protein [Spirochaetia bacterium]